MEEKKKRGRPSGTNKPTAKQLEYVSLVELENIPKTKAILEVYETKPSNANAMVSHTESLSGTKKAYEKVRENVLDMVRQRAEKYFNELDRIAMDSNTNVETKRKILTDMIDRLNIREEDDKVTGGIAKIEAIFGEALKKVEGKKNNE